MKVSSGLRCAFYDSDREGNVQHIHERSFGESPYFFEMESFVELRFCKFDTIKLADEYVSPYVTPKGKVKKIQPAHIEKIQLSHNVEIVLPGDYFQNRLWENKQLIEILQDIGGVTYNYIVDELTGVNDV